MKVLLAFNHSVLICFLDAINTLGLSKLVMEKQKLSQASLDRIIEMAWEDRTPFEAIFHQFAITESAVIEIMRDNLKRSSFNLWRKRVNSGVSSKHLKLRSTEMQRFKCSRQKSISNNKISKR